MKHLLLVLGLVLVTMFAVTTTAKANECLAADLNGDGAVDFKDFILFADAFGKSNLGECEPPPPQPAANACQHLKEFLLYIYVFNFGGGDNLAGVNYEDRAEAFGVELNFVWADTIAVKIGAEAFGHIQKHINDELPRWNRARRRPPTPWTMYKRAFTIADSLLQCNAGPFRCLWIDEFVEYYSPFHGENESFDRASLLWSWFGMYFWFGGSQVVDQARDALRPLTSNENERPSFEKLKSVVKPILGCE